MPRLVAEYLELPQFPYIYFGMSDDKCLVVHCLDH